MGGDIFYLGDNGAGQTAKLCNQLLVGAELLSICEAFHLSKSADIDPEQLYDVLVTCIGTSGILEQKGERLLNLDFEPGADMKLQQKDSQLILDLAQSSGVPTYLSAIISQTFTHAVQSGFESQDHFGIYNLFRRNEMDEQ